MNIPACAMSVLSMFRPVFSTPTYHRFCVLMLAAVLTTGRHTITNLLRTVRYQAHGHVSSYHRVFSQRRWSAWALARVLITFVLDYLVPPGPVLLAGDDTVTERPGPKVFARDGIVMGCGRPTAIPPTAGDINGSSCRYSSSGRLPPGLGRSPSWWPCTAPRNGIACTAHGIRRQPTSPGCCCPV
jgi:DDE superfamily endonuclease